MKNSRFAYQIRLELAAYREKKLLIAFSGGVDSCALLEVLQELKENLKIELALAHIHHGENGSPEQKIYRDRALEFSRVKAKERKCPFFFELCKSEDSGTSEASMRKLRHAQLEKIRVKEAYDFLVFAHHAQDLFETRLIRLVRGTGPQGLVSMQLRSEFKLRPLLKIWPEQILAYVNQKKIEYLQDPSNEDRHYLRNWIRHQWLPELEQKRQGGIRSFARSLELLSETSPRIFLTDMQRNEAVIDRESYRGLSSIQKRDLIVSCLQKIKKQNYSANMVREICKRLDSPQKNLKFRVAGFDWSASAHKIQVIQYG